MGFLAIAAERILTALAVKLIRMIADMAINELTPEDAENTIDSLAGKKLKVIDDIKRSRKR